MNSVQQQVNAVRHRRDFNVGRVVKRQAASKIRTSKISDGRDFQISLPVTSSKRCDAVWLGHFGGACIGMRFDAREYLQQGTGEFGSVFLEALGWDGEAKSSNDMTIV
jgi:hypothetical protein